MTHLGAIATRFGVSRFLEEVGHVPRYNVAPTQTVIVVNDAGTRHLAEMRWGLIPSWAKEAAIGNRMINARAETVATKPAFRVTRRYLVLRKIRNGCPRGRKVDMGGAVG